MDKKKGLMFCRRIVAEFSVMRGIALILVVLISLVGCGKPSSVIPEQDEIIPPPPPPTTLPEENGTVSVVIPVGMVPGFDYTWVASWESGTAPFSIAWDFGGGAENTAATDATSPSPVSITMASEPSLTYTYTVVVTDAEGSENEASGTFEIGEIPTEIPEIVEDEADGGDGEDNGGDAGGDEEPVPNVAPTIEAVEEELGTIIVSVNDSDNAVVAVFVSGIPGMVAALDTQLVAVPGTAIFNFAADQYYFVDAGTTTITVNDGNGGIVTEDVMVNPPVPEEYFLTAEYDRASGMLTLNRDFTNREFVVLKFVKPYWIHPVLSYWVRINGKNVQMVPGEWTSMEIELDFHEVKSNFDDLTIMAQAFSGASDPLPSSPVFETTVHIIRPLFISLAEYDNIAEEYSVEIDAVDGAELSIETSYTNGIQGTELQQDADNPNRYTAQVDYSSSENKYGNVGVIVGDQFGNTDTVHIFLQHESVEIINDQLHAIFEKEKAEVGEEILVTVTTGQLSHPFQFMLNVGLVVDEDAEYVEDSFNVGSPGGKRDFPDGIWTMVDPIGFILGPDVLIQPGADPEQSLEGKSRIDFNVSPFRGNDVSGAGGDLFNCRFKYTEPGIKTLTFQDFNGVNRTYYNDLEESRDTFWDDSSNSHPGMQTSIVVE